MTSGLNGVSKIPGSFILPTGFPVRSKTTLVLANVFHRHFPCGDSSDMYVICGISSGICFGGRAGYRSFIGRFSGPGMLPSSTM